MCDLSERQFAVCVSWAIGRLGREGLILQAHPSAHVRAGEIVAPGARASPERVPETHAG